MNPAPATPPAVAEINRLHEEAKRCSDASRQALHGALVAAWQADHAPDIAMRRTFRVIAEQEREHARLAADIHAWAIGRFPELAPTLDAARSDAVGRLRASLGPGRTDVGEPPRRVAERFVAGLDQIFAA